MQDQNNQTAKPQTVAVNPARTAILATAWITGMLLLGAVLIYGKNVLIPLAVAVLVWHMINAIANRYGKVSIRGHQMTPGLSLILALATIVAACWAVFDIVANNVALVSELAPAYQDNLRKIASDLPSWMGIQAMPTIDEFVARIDVGNMIGVLTSAFGALIGNTGLVALYVMFLMLEQASFDKKISALFPDPERAGQVRRMLSATEQRIERYLWIKTMMSVITAGLSYLVLITVGVDYPGFWALTVFLFNYIPTVGSIIAVILPGILTLLQFASVTTALALTATLIGIQFVVGNVLEPRYMGTSLNLSPLVIMLSLALWGSVWGLAGMVLCVPITVILAIFCSQFKSTRPIAVILSSDGKIG